MDRYVGIGEYCVSQNKTDVIKTLALSSCVAIAVYDPSVYVAGMAHIVLPSYFSDTDIENCKPCYYATLGVPFLINKMVNGYGCIKSRMVVELVGGADSINNHDLFMIGRKNRGAIKIILENMKLPYTDKETGNIYSRSLELDVATGMKTIIRQPIII